MKTLMREIATYNNCVFSMSLWGAYRKATGEYIVHVSYQEEQDGETLQKMYKLEGELKEVFKTYEAMIEVMKSKAKYREE